MKFSFVMNLDIHLFFISLVTLLFLQNLLSSNITLLIIFNINIFLFKFFSSFILSKSFSILFKMNSSWNFISENKSQTLSFISLSSSFNISNNKLNLSASKQINSSFS